MGLARLDLGRAAVHRGSMPHGPAGIRTPPPRGARLRAPRRSGRPGPVRSARPGHRAGRLAPHGGVGHHSAGHGDRRTLSPAERADAGQRRRKGAALHTRCDLASRLHDDGAPHHRVRRRVGALHPAGQRLPGRGRRGRGVSCWAGASWARSWASSPPRCSPPWRGTSTSAASDWRTWPPPHAPPWPPGPCSGPCPAAACPISRWPEPWARPDTGSTRHTIHSPWSWERCSCTSSCAAGPRSAAPSWPARRPWPCWPWPGSLRCWPTPPTNRRSSCTGSASPPCTINAPDWSASPGWRTTRPSACAPSTSTGTSRPCTTRPATPCWATWPERCSCWARSWPPRAGDAPAWSSSRCGCWR